jgi:hypothetical protein
MQFKSVLNAEIGLPPAAQIAGRGSLFHPAENKARQNVALLQLLGCTAKTARGGRHLKIVKVSGMDVGSECVLMRKGAV